MNHAKCYCISTYSINAINYQFIALINYIYKYYISKIIHKNKLMNNKFKFNNIKYALCEKHYEKNKKITYGRKYIQHL